MRSSKVKFVKQVARLNGRIEEYEKLSATDKPAYTKPGSMKK